jgi:predicted metal-binding membrane protein
VGIPAYFAWKSLMGPLSDGRDWAGYLAGGVLVACALYQVSPLKQACLRHCRSPMSFFLRQPYNLKKPEGAARAGALHGCVCLGCCWAEMAVLVAMGTMSLAWMVGMSALIYAEKATPLGRRASAASSLAMVALAAVLFANPHLISHIT